MTTLLPYLCVGGVEIANPCRLKAYVQRTAQPRPDTSWSWKDDCDKCCCGDYDDGPYTYPSNSVSSSPAPWADAARPETDEFFGVHIRWMTMDTPVLRLGATDYTLGRLTPKKRTITAEADLVASTERGAAYGYQWLVQALLDASDCGPNGCTDVAIVYVSCDTVTGNGARRLFGVGLVDIQDITPQDGSLPATAGRRVSFTLECEVPWLYSIDDSFCIINSPWNLNPVLNNHDCESVWDDWLTRICEADLLLPTAEDFCALPADCRPRQAPIVKPTPLSTCFCEPIYQAVQCCSTPTLPDWSQAVLTFIVEAGSLPMRNARIRVFQNPTNQLCPDDVSPSDPVSLYWADQIPVASMEITYMPAFSKLIVDGRIGAVLLYCKGVCFDADSYVTGPNATVWDDPVIECVGGSLCACMYVDAAHTATNATLTVQVTERTLA